VSANVGGSEKGRIFLKIVGKIAQVWRYPVSSVGGERLNAVFLDSLGASGDRQYALIDAASGLPAIPEKDARWRKSLQLTARCNEKDGVSLLFPDGRAFSIDDVQLRIHLTEYFDFPVAVAVYEDAKAGSNFPVTRHRHEHAPVHLLTTSSLYHLANLRQTGSIDVRRFRPTFLIETDAADGFQEADWIGEKLRIGTLTLHVREETKRCGVTFLAQPNLREDPEILRNILRHNKRHLGAYCTVEGDCIIRQGDEVVMRA
jgi:uncharacterized protein YcbX